MDGEQMELRFTYTRDSYIAACEDCARAFPAPAGRTLWTVGFWAFYLVFCARPLLSAVRLRLAGLPVCITDPWTAVAYAVIVAIPLWELASWLRRRLRPRAQGYDDNERWQDERHWIVGDAGLQTESYAVRSDYKWAAFEQVVQAPHTYIFVSARNDRPNWLYLPRYAFASTEQEESFRAIVKRNVRFEAARRSGR